MRQRYEHKTLAADSLVSPEQLDDMSEEGWLLIQIVESDEAGSRWIFYFRRAAEVH